MKYCDRKPLTARNQNLSGKYLTFVQRERSKMFKLLRVMETWTTGSSRVYRHLCVFHSRLQFHFWANKATNFETRWGRPLKTGRRRLKKFSRWKFLSNFGFFVSSRTLNTQSVNVRRHVCSVEWNYCDCLNFDVCCRDLAAHRFTFFIVKRRVRIFFVCSVESRTVYVFFMQCDVRAMRKWYLSRH